MMMKGVSNEKGNLAGNKSFYSKFLIIARLHFHFRQESCPRNIFLRKIVSRKYIFEQWDSGKTNFQFIAFGDLVFLDALASLDFKP